MATGIFTGETLRIFRQLAGFSQQDIASLLGRTQAYVSNVERGFTPLRPAEEHIIARALAVAKAAKK